MSPVVKVGHIDDVQELAKAKSTSIPQRFVRETTERLPTQSEPPSSDIDVPTLDFSNLMLPATPEIYRSEIAKLEAACREWGFFQVVNHGIEDVCVTMEKVTTEFFMLPLEEKKKSAIAPGGVQGYGQAFVFSEDQKLDWCNMLSLAMEPQRRRRPDLWPAKPLEFSETFQSYTREVGKLCKNLSKFIAISFGLEGHEFIEMFGEVVQGSRINYYPPCPRPDLVLGLSAHSDGSAFTVLQQTANTSAPVGLQIVHNNAWVPIKPIPNALVINIGDTIEVLTNGKYKSVEHRAVTHKEKDRLSIANFYAPNDEVELGPMPQFVDQNNPCKFRRYNHGDYSRHYVTNKLQGKKNLDFAKID